MHKFAEIGEAFLRLTGTGTERAITRPFTSTNEPAEDNKMKINRLRTLLVIGTFTQANSS